MEMSKFKARPRENRGGVVARLQQLAHHRRRHVDPLTFRRSFDVDRINLPAYSLKFDTNRVVSHKTTSLARSCTYEATRNYTSKSKKKKNEDALPGIIPAFIVFLEVHRHVRE